MNNLEDKQLNQPTRNYFKKKMKCAVARTEFSFFAGKLDVLAYDRREKCFHISEGKRSSNIASVGHAIGQLIAYMSMIQERGYDFLDLVSKSERLELSDFASFLENKNIRVCFYVTMPAKDKEKLLPAAKLMLKNLGDFGSSIGIFFADQKNCEFVIPARPILIRLRKTYNRHDFLEETLEKIYQFKESRDLIPNETRFQNILQLKESIGNPYLHFEIWIKQKRKKDVTQKIEIAFHLEFAKAHLALTSTVVRKKKLQKVMRKSFDRLKTQGEDFKLQLKWGKNWSKLYSVYETQGLELDQDDVAEVTRRFIILINELKPKFDKINWGRNKRIKEVWD